MPSTSIGVYPGSASAVENDEVSSTYLGRHLTFLANDITGQEHTLVTKGHPVVIGEHIVGVAFMTEVLGTDLIPIDTEGIWNLMVYPKDDDGAIDVVAGDELWINKSSAEISKMRNPVTHTKFGYALGGVTTVVGNEVIAVKVHWDGADEIEFIGERATPSVSALASHTFRKYCYEAQGGTEQVGDWLEMAVTTVACFWAAAMFRRLSWTNATNLITGYSAVAEFELAIGAGAGSMDTCTVIQLNSMIGTLSATGHNNFRLSWLRMQDYAGAVNEQINIFLELIDDLATYPAANNNTDLFVATSGDKTPSHALKFMVNGVNYWFLCCSTN